MCENIVAGLISGLISGILVTLFFNGIERKRRIKQYWRDYLWKSLERCDLYISEEMIEMLKPLGGQNSKFGAAIINIHDLLYPMEDKELSQEEQQLFAYFCIAYQELNQWCTFKKMMSRIRKWFIRSKE